MTKQVLPQLQRGSTPLPTKTRIYPLGLLFSLILWFLLVCLILPPEQSFWILQSLGWEYPQSEALRTITLVAAIVYFVNSFASPALRYLWHLNPVEDVVTYIKRREATPPQLGFTCACSHMETRTRFVTEYYIEYETQWDSSTQSSRSVPVTKTRQRMETYQEQVVTYSGHKQFNFSRWDDISVELTEDIYHYQAIQVDFSFTVDFGDDQVRKQYNMEKEQFISRNRYRDTQFNFHEYCRIPDYKPKMLSIVDIKRKSPLLHWSVYVLLTLIGLSWLYRVWFDRNTVYGTFLFWKRIFA